MRDKKLKFFFPVICFACKIGAIVLVPPRMLRTFDRGVLEAYVEGGMKWQPRSEWLNDVARVMEEAVPEQEVGEINITE